MGCLLVTCITITAQLGLQSGFEHDGVGWNQVEEVGNRYGAIPARANIIFDHGPFFTSISHLSGVSTIEYDGGFNFVSIGRKHNWGPLYLKSAIGIQSQMKIKSNDYGLLVHELAGGVEWKGLFAEVSKVDGMEMLMGGIKTTF